MRTAGAAAAYDADPGRGPAMAGRSGKLYCIEWAKSCTRRADARSLMAIWRMRRAHCQPPNNPPLKDPKDFTLIGKPLKRLDTPDKVNGKAVYGIDAMLPGMKFATLAQCPVFGGKVGACRRQRGQGQLPAFGRSSCSTIWSRSSAITCGPPRKVSMRSSSPGTKDRTRSVDSKDIWRGSARRQRKDRRRREIHGDIAKGLAQRRQV